MIAYIGVGSNINEPTLNIKKALSLAIRGGEVEILKSSSLYETSPWGLREQPNFINAVWSVKTTLTPVQLFLYLKKIEVLMGRKKVERYGPRIIDLDVLFYDDLVYQDANLTIPHPKLAERSFVIFPMAELAPNFVHPLLGVTMEKLKVQLKELLNIKKLSNT